MSEWIRKGERERGKKGGKDRKKEEQIEEKILIYFTSQSHSIRT